MLDSIPPLFRLSGGQTIIPVELGKKSRPFEKTVLLGKHWQPARSTAKGDIGLSGECQGPLRIRLDNQAHDDKSVIHDLGVWCTSCGLRMVLHPKSYANNPFTRPSFNFELVRLIRDTFFTMYLELSALDPEKTTMRTRFLEAINRNRVIAIGCLMLQEGKQDDHTCLGLVPSSELALQAVATGDYLLSQVEEQSRLTSKAMGGLLGHIANTIDFFPAS